MDILEEDIWDTPEERELVRRRVILGLPAYPAADVPLFEAAQVLRVKAAKIRSAAESGQINLGKQGEIDLDTLEDLHTNPPHWITGKAPADSTSSIKGSVQNTKVTMHIGPTNSGKTYHALQALCEAQGGIYAAPLRMLAQEAYERLCKALGEEKVGLLTGEEAIRPDAPILACTPEMAPESGRVLLLDEAHWAIDRERGPAWTRLLMAEGYEEKHIIASSDATPFLTKAFPDATWKTYTRLVPLKYIGGIKLKEMNPGTVLIAFSRRNVLRLAQRLEKLYPGRVAVLYGAMPPSVRRLQIDRFISGECDYVVATDVLGHGVNLPCRSVVFASTTKFDGERERELENWEAAQIAGRAGRYGMGDHDMGEVAVLIGEHDFKANGRLIKAAVENTTGPFRTLDYALMRPRLKDLRVDRADQLVKALSRWEKENKNNQPDWIRLQPVKVLTERLRALGYLTQKLPLDFAWTFTLGIGDVDHSGDNSLLMLWAHTVANGSKKKTKGWNAVRESLREPTWELFDLEKQLRAISLLKWMTYVTPGVIPFTRQELEKWDNACSTRMQGAIKGKLKGNY